MTNPFKKIFLFIVYFGLFTSISLWSYYHFQDTPFKREMLLFDLAHISQNCPNSPQKSLFQECFRPNIHPLTNKASPLEILSIPELLNSYYEQDKIQGPTYFNHATKAFIINQVIFYEALSKFSVSRNSLDFFQIVMLPFFRWKLSLELKETKKLMKEILDHFPLKDLSPIEKRYFDKFSQLSVSAA